MRACAETTRSKKTHKNPQTVRNQTMTPTIIEATRNTDEIFSVKWKVPPTVRVKGAGYEISSHGVLNDHYAPTPSNTTQNTPPPHQSTIEVPALSEGAFYTREKNGSITQTMQGYKGILETVNQQSLQEIKRQQARILSGETTGTLNVEQTYMQTIERTGTTLDVIV